MSTKPTAHLRMGLKFRPEYRQFISPATHFPESPIAAFTASATRHVRHDILEQLQLRQQPAIIVSFHRRICATSRGNAAPLQPALLLEALRAHDGGSVIISRTHHRPRG